MNKEQLRSRLEKEKFHKSVYYLDSLHPPYEGFVLSETYGIWKVEYVERGIRRVLGEYSSEEEACDAFYMIISKDQGTREK